MKYNLLNILACPLDDFSPLRLYIFEKTDEIISGILVCQKCLHWYPIRERIPQMLPDKLRNEEDDLAFLYKWKNIVPAEVLEKGKPFNVKGIAQVHKNE
jgi:uncharacterized protein YbaR (Trm112 family)